MYWMNADPSTVSLSCQEESRCDWKHCDVVAHMPEMYAHRHALTHMDTYTGAHTHGHIHRCTHTCTHRYDQISGCVLVCQVFFAQTVPTPSAAVLKESFTTAFVYHLSSLRVTSCLRQLQLLEKLPNLFSNEAILLELIT